MTIKTFVRAMNCRGVTRQSFSSQDVLDYKQVIARLVNDPTITTVRIIRLARYNVLSATNYPYPPPGKCKMKTTAQKLITDPDNLLDGYVQIHRLPDAAEKEPGVIKKGNRNQRFYIFADGSMLTINHRNGHYDIDWPKKIHQMYSKPI